MCRKILICLGAFGLAFGAMASVVDQLVFGNSASEKAIVSDRGKVWIANGRELREWEHIQRMTKSNESAGTGFFMSFIRCFLSFVGRSFG
jgi:hypothetical protein